MFNPLTGDFEAALEARVETLNRILATLHQKGAFEGASPSFLHSITARVGEVPNEPKLELAEAFVLQNFVSTGGDAVKLPQDLLTRVQADLLRARRTLMNASSTIGSADPSLTSAVVHANFPELFVVRGTIKAQLSTLTVSFPEGTTSEATVRCHVRAFYMPDPGTEALPSPIHGEVLVGFIVKYYADGPKLEVQVTSDDSKIQFVPEAGTNLTTADTKRIAKEIRRFVRTKFKEMIADLPSKQQFPFQRFKSLGAGPMQAIAMPFNLSPDAKIPAFANFPPVFLATGDDFAVAISKEGVDFILKGALDELRKFKTNGLVTIGFPVPYPPFWHEVTWAYKVTVASVDLLWEVGKIVLRVEGKLTTDPDDPSTTFAVKQGLKLQLNPDSQTIVLSEVGELEITGLPSEIEALAKPKIEGKRNQAIEDAKQQIDKLTEQLNIGNTLKPFDAQAKSKFTSLEVGPAGLVLHGTLEASQRLPVIVMAADLILDGKAVSALKSWVPAGTIDKFVWSWVSKDPTKPAGPFDGTEHEISRTHSFLFQPLTVGGSQGAEKTEPKAPPWETYQLCLRVEGRQVRSKSGPLENVEGGTTCQIQHPDWTAIVPSWWDAILLAPVWGPDPGPEAVLEDAIVAHVNMRSPTAAVPASRTTSLIHFSDAQFDAVLPMLGEAVLRSRYRDANLPIIVVLPSGSFAQTKSVLERRLGAFKQELRVPLVVTEDYEGAWTQAFGSAGQQATFLLSGDGEIAWSHAGRLDAASLTTVLDQHVKAGPRRRSRPLGLDVRAGDRAPEVLLDGGDASSLSAARLRGRRIAVMFWKSCSRPCLTELRRLEQVHERSGRQGPVIYAVGDGETPERIADIAREHQLRLTLVPDPDRRIARHYGVNCWPTLVSINEQGVIDTVHSGLTHHRSRAARRAEEEVNR